ncbi:MAG TPA: bifunctional diguanylate cyclase/phosphodiesterase [Rhodopila sp.]
MQAAVGNAGSRKAVVACSLPQVLYFLSVPFLIAQDNTTLILGLVVVLSGLVHGLGILEVWSVTEKRFESEQKARLAGHVARHDPETHLPNRLTLEEKIAAESQKDQTLMVAVLEINRFADLRGAIGYALAAELIRQVSIRLDDHHGGIVARLSSSTLGLLFHAQNLSQAHAYAARLQAAMATPVVVAGIDVDITFTIGLASLRDSDSASLLLEHASVALDAARRASISVNVFETSQDANLAGNLSLMSDMLRSIKTGEITNYYQPKYDLRSGRLVGVEALVRWHHPERGFVAPDLFIPVAEETGRIRELTLDVLSRAIRDQAWLADRGHKLDFAVNLSGRLLQDAEIIQTIIDIARPAAPRVSMEVTETAMMAYPEKAIALLQRLRSAGIGLSIDDYGTGLSSLAYLKNIPAAELKIDRSFVTHLDTCREDELLVRSTIALAHSLGLRVVAEGVESRRTLEILRSVECDLAQGYYLARPLPLARLARLLENDLARPNRACGHIPEKLGL